MSRYWVHSSGDDEQGRCLACEEEYPNRRRHEVRPDPESDRDEPWCWTCGHDVELVAIKEKNDADLPPVP